MDEVTVKWEVLYFAPDGDHRQPRGTEEAARRFAAREDIVRWNPIIEKITTTVRREFVYNAAAHQPTDSSLGHPEGEQ